MLIQFFILEQLLPVQRFLLGKKFFKFGGVMLSTIDYRIWLASWTAHMLLQGQLEMNGHSSSLIVVVSR
jgi:hypothetical protein